MEMDEAYQILFTDLCYMTNRSEAYATPGIGPVLAKHNELGWTLDEYIESEVSRELYPLELPTDLTPLRTALGI